MAKYKTSKPILYALSNIVKSEMMQTIMPALKKDRMKRQAPKDFVRQIGRNLNKLVGELKSAQSPEAMVYMRLLGNEVGYLKTNEIQEMAYSATMMIDSMMKMFPGDKHLVAVTGSEVMTIPHSDGQVDDHPLLPFTGDSK
ncbi:unnamed protein product [Pleuronectes platessa]|uniref:Vitellinogen open beta-sheet domain-containing protein n=1 Tax=Pleuronectes platessa TaxID=8262 RepID=A0A9N7YLZ8_PLEPL|nr:unnamed protein product [Pleuronectes platessa]